MTKKISILLIIFGVWGILELIPISSIDIRSSNKIDFLLQQIQYNTVFYRIIRTSICINKIVGILPLILGLLILYKKYIKAYLLTKFILFLKILFFPVFIFILSKYFIIKEKEAFSETANILAFISIIMSLACVIAVYVYILFLLKRLVISKMGSE